MYKTVREIDFFSDQNLRQKLVRLSLSLVFVPAFGLGVYSAITMNQSSLPAALQLEGLSILLWLFLLVLLTFVALPLHELIHALFFKSFHPKAHIIFGFKDAMLYAGCPGEVYTRAQMIIILLAPAFFISLALIVLYFTTSVPVLCFAVLILHLSGCSGDILAAWLIVREPTCTHCEDTDFGIRLLSE